MAFARSVPVILSFVFFFFFISVGVSDAYDRIVGGRSEIGDVRTNKEVQALGRFSVHEFNRRSAIRRHGDDGGELRFVEVVAAQRQVVSGIKYFLTVDVSPASGGERMTFDSMVVVKPWLRSKQLVAFSPSNSPKVRS